MAKIEHRTFLNAVNYENQMNTCRKTGLIHVGVDNTNGTEAVPIKLGHVQRMVPTGQAAILISTPANPTPKQMLGLGLKNPNMLVV